MQLALCTRAGVKDAVKGFRVGYLDVQTRVGALEKTYGNQRPD